MSSETKIPAVDDSEPVDPWQEAARRAQIEQRLQHLFRLAGDNEPAQALMRLVVEYRLRQQS